MGRRLSPQQLKSFKEIIRNKRVLDVGNEQSPFLAAEFARYARSWTMVGRTPTLPMGESLPTNIVVVAQSFDTWLERPLPSDFDVILLSFPSPSSNQDSKCIEWSTTEHMIVFFGHPTDDSISGSPEFWKLISTLDIQRDERDIWSRMILIRKSTPAKTDKPHLQRDPYPKKGDRYRLVASFRWPDKKPGERPPIVEVVKNWEKNSGPAKIIGSGEILRLRKHDLGAPM